MILLLHDTDLIWYHLSDDCQIFIPKMTQSSCSLPKLSKVIKATVFTQYNTNFKKDLHQIKHRLITHTEHDKMHLSIIFLMKLYKHFSYVSKSRIIKHESSSIPVPSAKAEFFKYLFNSMSPRSNFDLPPII